MKKTYGSGSPTQVVGRNVFSQVNIKESASASYCKSYSSVVSLHQNLNNLGGCWLLLCYCYLEKHWDQLSREDSRLNYSIGCLPKVVTFKIYRTEASGTGSRPGFLGSKPLRLNRFQINFLIKMLYIFMRTSNLQAKSPTLLQREYPALKHMKFNTFFVGI